MIPVEIVHIFGGVYSIKYQGASNDALTDLLDKWSDPEFIKAKYDECSSFITTSKYYEKEGVNSYDKIKKHISARLSVLKGELDNLAEQIPRVGNKSLDLFEPLGAGIRFSGHKLFYKLKPARKNRFLRIYAIKLNDRTFVIVGGVIKFHNTMESSYYDECKLQLKNTLAYLKNMQLIEE